SNAVLNVIPDDWRANVLHDMASRLKTGGKLFINTRKAGEERAIKDKIELDSPQEVLVKRNGRIASYQRFFTPKELQQWVEQQLGEGYEVEIANERNSGTKGLAAVVVTKRTVAEGGKSTRYRTAEEGVDYYNSRIVQPWVDRLEELRDKRRQWGYLSEGEKAELRELAEQERQWEADYAATHTDTPVKTGRRSRFDVIGEQYDRSSRYRRQFNQLERIYSKAEVRDANGEIIPAETRAKAEEALRILDQWRQELLEERSRCSRAGQAEIDAELAELEHTALYYERMAEGEDVERRMPPRAQYLKMKDSVDRLGRELGVGIEVVEKLSDIAEENPRITERKRRAKGWYDPATGKVVINMANHGSVRDVVRTVLHEVIGHKALEEIMGREGFERFIREVYLHADEEMRRAINAKVARNNWDYQEATREHIAELAETVMEKGYDRLEKAQQTLWNRIKSKLEGFINRVLSGMNIPARVKLSDRDVGYMLWKLMEHRRAEAAKGRGRISDRRTGETGAPVAEAEAGDIFAQAEAISRREAMKRDADSMQIVARDGQREADAEQLERVNRRFNEELQQQVDGTLPKGHIYQMGMPGETLRAAGVEDLPIELSAERLATKASESYKSNHPFELGAVTGLVEAINNPIAVFDSATRSGVKVILTTLQYKGQNFVVALEAQKRNTGKSHAVEVNNILSLYPKEGVEGILNWINKGKMLYRDNKKMRAFFHDQWPDYIVEGKDALNIEVNQKATSDADLNSRIESAAKIVNEFENPKLNSEKNSYRDSEEIRFRDGEDERPLQERLTDIIVEMAGRHRDNTDYRDAAIEAIGNRMKGVNKARFAQRQYDRATIDLVTSTVKKLMANGLLDEVQNGEIGRLMSTIKHSLDNDEIEGSVRRLTDIVAENQLRLAGEMLDRITTIKGSKVDA
ncbi:MAG: hypothetical protein K2H61_04655, partial [Muribaculaceae bacterium]|nr:hypothetical protein [Muribaculaceae bacterium]